MLSGRTGRGISSARLKRPCRKRTIERQQLGRLRRDDGPVPRASIPQYTLQLKHRCATARGCAQWREVGYSRVKGDEIYRAGSQRGRSTVDGRAISCSRERDTTGAGIRAREAGEGREKVSASRSRRRETSFGDIERRAKPLYSRRRGDVIIARARRSIFTFQNRKPLPVVVPEANYQIYPAYICRVTRARYLVYSICFDPIAAHRTFRSVPR